MRATSSFQVNVMRFSPKLVVAAATLLIFGHVCAADGNRISAGDYLFVHAQVIGCGTGVRTIDAGQVNEGGTLTLLGDIELEAEDKTVDEVTADLVNAWQARTGQQSKTIQLIKIPAADAETATMLLLQLYQDRKQGCDVPMWEYPVPGLGFPVPDWQNIFQIAQARLH